MQTLIRLSILFLLTIPILAEAELSSISDLHNPDFWTYENLNNNSSFRVPDKTDSFLLNDLKEVLPGGYKVADGYQSQPCEGPRVTAARRMSGQTSPS